MPMSAKDIKKYAAMAHKKMMEQEPVDEPEKVHNAKEEAAEPESKHGTSITIALHVPHGKK